MVLIFHKIHIEVTLPALNDDYIIISAIAMLECVIRMIYLSHHAGFIIISAKMLTRLGGSTAT